VHVVPAQPGPAANTPAHITLLLLLLLLYSKCHRMTPGPLCTWYRPTNLDQLLTLKSAHNDLKLVGGNSEVRVDNAGCFTEHVFFASRLTAM
jgi:hypothetical protein